MTDEKMNIQLRMDKVVTEMEKIFDAYGLSDSIQDRHLVPPRRTLLTVKVHGDRKK